MDAATKTAQSRDRWAWPGLCPGDRMTASCACSQLSGINICVSCWLFPTSPWTLWLCVWKFYVREARGRDPPLPELVGNHPTRGCLLNACVIVLCFSRVVVETQEKSSAALQLLRGGCAVRTAALWELSQAKVEIRREAEREWGGQYISVGNYGISLHVESHTHTHVYLMPGILGSDERGVWV